jgi:hypothetical protein
LEYAELMEAKRGIAKPDDIRFAIAADSNVLITGADCAARFAIARLIYEAPVAYAPGIGALLARRLAGFEARMAGALLDIDRAAWLVEVQGLSGGTPREPTIRAL